MYSEHAELKSPTAMSTSKGSILQKLVMEADMMTESIVTQAPTEKKEKVVEVRVLA